MSDGTHVQWADASWPVTAGCEVVSDGCEHCYAATLTSTRLRHLPDYAGLAAGGKFTGEVRLASHKLDWPLKWRKPRRIFVASMSDLFHDSVPDEFIARVFAVMALAAKHSFQLLTKRHGRMRSLLSSEEFPYAVADALDELGKAREDNLPLRLFRRVRLTGGGWPLRNVWCGVSVENQQWADIRIPALLNTPAAVRWVSAEPLLGPVDLNRLGPRGLASALSTSVDQDSGVVRRGLDWVVIGGESGPGARPMHPDWARSLRDQCVDAGVPFFYKQDGSWAPVTDRPQFGDVWLAPDGATRPWEFGDGHTRTGGGPFRNAGAIAMRRNRKSHGGRELDGRTWDEYPNTNHTEGTRP